MSKVSIEREELVRLRDLLDDTKQYSYGSGHQHWEAAMSMLNAMLMGEEHSVCKGCHFDGGDCYSQKKLGGWVNSCAMRVPATPPAPQVDYSDGSALGPRGHTDPGYENLMVDGRLPPQYVTRQEMEVAIEKMRDRILGSVGLPIGERLREHEFRFHRVEVDVEAIAKAAVDAALKMREEKRHGMKPLSALVCEDCAHVDVCAMRNNQNPQNCGHVLRTTPQS